MRGEKSLRVNGIVCWFGSSPRAWGKDFPTAACARPARIIPTCVGKRPTSSDLASRSPDHPHVRGEKSHAPPTVLRLAGSSPRAWGKASFRYLFSRFRRIIPTCVGKRYPFDPFHPVLPDHPHVRGEKIHARNNNVSHAGSSPRAWGKGLSIRRPRQSGRIIPTCVGKRNHSNKRIPP